MKIDHLSLCNTPIYLLDNDIKVLQGRGFYYCHREKDLKFVYLVTNHHVLTGGSPKNKGNPKGNKILFYLHKSKENPGEIKEIRFPLYTKNNDPVWVNNSKHPEADLAVIPLLVSQYSDCDLHCITYEWTKTEFLVRPSTPVTLIGYPFEYYDKKNSLPIWKTGNIASEPEIDFENKPMFLVDVSAFPGMSGSPVFAIAAGMYEKEEGVVTSGIARKFLGIYASMASLIENKYLEEFIHNVKKGITITQSLQIGHVWKANIIIDTINSINIKNYKEKITKYLK